MSGNDKANSARSDDGGNVWLRVGNKLAFRAGNVPRPGPTLQDGWLKVKGVWTRFF